MYITKYKSNKDGYFSVLSFGGPLVTGKRKEPYLPASIQDMDGCVLREAAHPSDLFCGVDICLSIAVSSFRR